MLALGLDATAHYGLAAPDIRMGDVGLFAALVAALDLAPAWKRRLIKDFNHKTSLAHDLDRLTISASSARPEYQGVLAALAGSDPKGAHALVTDLLSIAGISAVGGRSVGEIADRFLEQATLGAQTSLPRETRALIERFLAIAGDPDEAAAELDAFARDANIALDAALDLFESRIGFLAARGVELRRIRFSTAFGRGLDYYTGFVFELHDPRAQTDGQLVAGGRYDGLLTRLGSARAIPAVGFAVWIERLGRGAGRAMSAPLRHRGAGQRAAAGERGSLLRARRARARQAARRARLSRHHRRPARRRGRLSLGRRDRRAPGAGRGAFRRHRRRSACAR